MTNAMKPLATSEEFKNLIITLSDMPFVVFGVAAVFTAVMLQSCANCIKIDFLIWLTKGPHLRLLHRTFINCS